MGYVNTTSIAEMVMGASGKEHRRKEEKHEQDAEA